MLAYINYSVGKFLNSKTHRNSLYAFNPLNPNIHMQILQTDLYTFLYRISWGNR